VRGLGPMSLQHRRNIFKHTIKQTPSPYGGEGGVRGLGSISLKYRGNIFKHAVNIGHDVDVPVAENKVSHCFEYLCSLRVGFRLHGMLSAVELNDQVRIGAAEVDDEAVYGKLPSEFPTADTTVAQPKPQHAPGVCLIAA
jgi:hypothetical protein